MDDKDTRSVGDFIRVQGTMDYRLRYYTTTTTTIYHYTTTITTFCHYTTTIATICYYTTTMKGAAELPWEIGKLANWGFC